MGLVRQLLGLGILFVPRHGSRIPQGLYGCLKQRTKHARFFSGIGNAVKSCILCRMFEVLLHFHEVFCSACQFFTRLTGFLPLSILYTAFKFAGKRITGKRTCRASSSDAELNLEQKRRFGTREIQLNSPFGENFLPRMFQHRLAHLLCYVH